MMVESLERPEESFGHGPEMNDEEFLALRSAIAGVRDAADQLIAQLRATNDEAAADE
jgi:hypothetical protein